MARVKLNPILQEISGSLGNDLMLRRLADGRTILCQKPDFSKREFSEKPLSHQDRFRRASAYAKQAAGTQPIYAELAAGTLKTAYNVALSDWFHPPQILEIALDDWNGKVGDIIRIQVHDDIMVAEVDIAIMDEKGAVREKGAATMSTNLWWHYQTQTANLEKIKIQVQAADLAGNLCESVLELG